jgi:hypothetical protein
VLLSSWVPRITGCLYTPVILPPVHTYLLLPHHPLKRKSSLWAVRAMKCSFDGGRLGFSVGLGSRRRSPEYPCVSRLRQRRLLSLLNRQELYHTFDSYVNLRILHLTLLLLATAHLMIQT